MWPSQLTAASGKSALLGVSDLGAQRRRNFDGFSDEGGPGVAADGAMVPDEPCEATPHCNNSLKAATAAEFLTLLSIIGCTLCAAKVPRTSRVHSVIPSKEERYFAEKWTPFQGRSRNCCSWASFGNSAEPNNATGARTSAAPAAAVVVDAAARRANVAPCASSTASSPVLSQMSSTRPVRNFRSRRRRSCARASSVGRQALKATPSLKRRGAGCRPNFSRTPTASRRGPFGPVTSKIRVTPKATASMQKRSKAPTASLLSRWCFRE
mmetsp:Transcript_117820/g.375613  ORF Transcript_117820/g.375613 Transcript_117820/m.375613 type:complete len:267 (-) Transcript_117820:359-1159(-)